jgi:hypothetical protein
MTVWDTLVPYLRDPAWPGWATAAWGEMPTVAVDAWAPRVGLVVGDGSARLVTEAELDRSRAPFEVHLATAIRNLTVHQPLRWRVVANRSVLGLAAKPAVAELVGELASEHLLVPAAILAALDALGADAVAMWSPVRGRLRAYALPRTAPGTRKLLDRLGLDDRGPDKEARAARDRFVDPGTSDPVTPAAFLAMRGADPALQLGLLPALPPPPYVPKLTRVVPGIVSAAQARGIPARELTAGPHGLRAALGVVDRGRFVPLQDVAFTALGITLDELWPRALKQLASPPIEDLRLFAGGTLLGCRGDGAAANVLRPEVVAALHQRLGPVVELTLTSPRLLTAFRGPLERGQAGAFVEIAMQLESAPGASLSAAVHRLEHGRLTASWTDA